MSFPPPAPAPGTGKSRNFVLKMIRCEYPLMTAPAFI
jgi:hypothetical protein